MRVYQYEVPPKSILSNLLGALHREPLTTRTASLCSKPRASLAILLFVIDRGRWGVVPLQRRGWEMS